MQAFFPILLQLLFALLAAVVIRYFGWAERKLPKLTFSFIVLLIVVNLAFVYRYYVDPLTYAIMCSRSQCPIPVHLRTTPVGDQASNSNQATSRAPQISTPVIEPTATKRPSRVSALELPNFSLERPLHQLAYTTDYFATALAMSANGRFFAQAHANSRNEIAIDIYVANTGTHFGRLYGHDAPIRSLDFSSDGQLLVSGDEDGQVIVWSVGTKSEERRFQDQKSHGTGSLLILPTKVAISDDGTKLAFGGQTETVTVRAVSGAKLYARIELHSGSENPVDFGAVGLNTMRMGIVTAKGRLPEYYQRASRQLRDVREPIADIAFSSDGSQIAVISYGTLNDVHVFDVSGSPIAQLSCRAFDNLGTETGGSFHPQSIAFAPFSSDIYFSGNVSVPQGANRGSAVRRWSNETNSCTDVLYNHPEPSSLLGLGLTFEGSRVALGGNGHITIVDTVTGLQTQRIADDKLFGFECSVEKNFIISAGSSANILAACGFGQPTIFAQ